MNTGLKFDFRVLFIISIFQICCTGEGLLSKDQSCQNDDYCSGKGKRYILYEVNRGEGFNLRRDIYIRIAPLIHALNEEDSKNRWILVLPPWGRLPHWRNTDLSKQFNWDTFFDIDNIRKYIPVLELEEYLEEHGFDNPIDIVYQLQHFPFEEPMTDWKEEIKTNVPCQDRFEYKLDPVMGHYTGYFWRQKLVTKEATCMALRGQASTLKPFLQTSKAKSIMFDRAEVILWDHYGGKDWWQARISLKFNNRLNQIAQQFLQDFHLSYVKSVAFPETSSTVGSADSKIDRRQYLAVHLRRRDFLEGRQKDVTSLEEAAQQILQACKQESLSDVFLATDANAQDIQELKSRISKSSEKIRLHQYHCQLPLLDGECAIIDQILCSYSNYFVGTKDSTFTSRIFEEREIAGVDPEKTYNLLCPNEKSDSNRTPPIPISCKKPTQWRIPK